ncbi:hypothetical protein J1605_000845 [Eschrichtius robustus]|uniref:Uncharacterized protein n=1 Tax=Eschrichtius robustus TaxID=9764 RepID=A0AB34GP94_ESCRO|nr:hypothetical protein J1605_000845 [Eschrichtius robustus]
MWQGGQSADRAQEAGLKSKAGVTPPLRCAAKAERVRRALRHRRCGGAGRRVAGALGGSGGRQAGRQAGRRSCRRVVVAVLAAPARPRRRRRPAPRPGRAELGRARAMLLTVYCVRRDLSEVTFSLQVDADFELHNFRALCELESGIPAAESQPEERVDCRAARPTLWLFDPFSNFSSLGCRRRPKKKP